MELPDAPTPSSRRRLKLVLLAFCGLILFWTVRLIFGPGSSPSNLGSLALCTGSALLVLASLDRNALRKRVWFIAALPMIGVSLVLAAVVLTRG
jgi:hypothetical protein